MQGVGFRPFVYNLAKSLKLGGWVLNSPQGVQIEAEGPQVQLEEFLVRLQRDKPGPAFIQSLEWSYLDAVGLKEFKIKQSKAGGKRLAFVLPDIATCDMCIQETLNPRDRRYLYPFTNCTLCGPRVSIIEKLPYDRPNTSMKSFEMCPLCKKEYKDPKDRRFHAQPIACNVCGPKLRLIDSKGAPLAGEDEALLLACAVVRSGGILGLKGIGGFLLLADASSDAALKRLRSRKLREEKPLALMYPNMPAVVKDCHVDSLESRLLTSPEKPIVLLRKKAECSASELVAPENPYLGVMLPYSPLHHLVTRELGFPVVATSGNLTDEPMAVETDEAVEKLGKIADAFLTHDRPIVTRMDDSIARVIDGREVVLRRARGYAPLPIEVAWKLPKVLALGGHLKNTVAMSIDKLVFVSQHIGDLETKEAVDAFQRTVRDFQELYEFKPEVVAVDMHPAYASTRHGESLGLELHKVQHHLAHVYSVMTDNGLDGSPLGISWDGTGYGEDGTVWGGEFIVPRDGKVEWLAGFEPFPLIGGEKAIKEPRRIALGMLHACFGDEAFEMKSLPTLEAFTEEELEWMKASLKHDLQNPRCRSVGRLFDGVASILGIRQRTSYEGQAAMALEFTADGKTDRIYPFDIRPGGRPKYLINWGKMFAAIMEDAKTGVGNEVISSKFHATLADMAGKIAEAVGEKRVVLSGGCFQNTLLVRDFRSLLGGKGFEVYTHQRIPPNDGGISLGQVIATAEAMR